VPAEKPTVSSTSPTITLGSQAGSVTQMPATATSEVAQSIRRRPSRSPSRPAAVDAQVPAR